ncbi:uncharacterized protein [Parasteatoda tepidariorum]|uniref:uncharacterized protein n=1 Tax=Parasteatoda tepidariorum TaxID=114398 RepID=UPI001C7295E1|nr:uncharacterized protein LOC107442305 [Parasteatoda tepidariorum]
MHCLIIICISIPIITAQYDSAPYQADPRQNYLNRPQGPSYYSQYSSLGSQGFSSESNSIYPGPEAPMPHSRAPITKQLPNLQQNEVIEEYHNPRLPHQQYNGGPRSLRHQESVFNTNVNDRQRRIDKPWSSSPREEYRNRQRNIRPYISRRDEPSRYSRHYQIDAKLSPLTTKRNPRIVKYIADKNGFALREDLVKPLQNTIDKVRQESKRRILTAAAPSGPPRSSSMMSHVVTSAIQVAGQPNNSGLGKFLPKIFDIKTGKRSNPVDRLHNYSIEKIL